MNLCTKLALLPLLFQLNMITLNNNKNLHIFSLADQSLPSNASSFKSSSSSSSEDTKKDGKKIFNNKNNRDSEEEEELLTWQEFLKLEPPNGDGGGLHVRLSRKGLEYATRLASRALPQILTDLTLPPATDDMYTIRNVRVEKFEKPTIETEFVPRKGIRVNVSLPLIMVNGMYEARWGFIEKKGKFRAEIQNLTLDMEVHVARHADSGKHLVEVPLCNGTTDSVLVVFAGGMSFSLNLIRSIVERRLVEDLGSTLCQVAIDATNFLRNEKEKSMVSEMVSNEKKYSSNSSSSSSGSSVQTDEQFSANERQKSLSDDEVREEASGGFGAALCEQQRMIPKFPNNNNNNEGGQESRGPAQWGVDFSLRLTPKFDEDEVVFGIDGGILYFGQRAESVERPRLPRHPKGHRMAGFIISDYIPNTFFAHVYANNLGVIREQLTVNDLPTTLRAVARLICWNCRIRLKAQLTSQPRMDIDRKGVRLDIQGDLGIEFDGPRNIQVVQASAHFDINVKPNVRHNRIYGDVSLTSVDVHVKKVGVGGVFGNSIKDVLGVIVPKKLWPKIKRRLRFALRRRGIKLPVFCGVELERIDLSYIDHAMLIDTDFSYDLPHFVATFKQYMKRNEQIIE